MRSVADWLLTSALAVACVAWCALCMTLPLMVVRGLPLPGWLVGPVVLVAAFGGLGFALWAMKRIGGFRRL